VNSGRFGFFAVQFLLPEEILSGVNSHPFLVEKSRCFAKKGHFWAKKRGKNGVFSYEFANIRKE
jgi:hypothetical protein